MLCYLAVTPVGFPGLEAQICTILHDVPAQVRAEREYPGPRGTWGTRCRGTQKKNGRDSAPVGFIID